MERGGNFPFGTYETMNVLCVSSCSHGKCVSSQQDCQLILKQVFFVNPLNALETPISQTLGEAG